MAEASGEFRKAVLLNNCSPNWTRLIVIDFKYTLQSVFV